MIDKIIQDTIKLMKEDSEYLDENVFYFKEAKLKRAKGGFWLLKGSKIRSLNDKVNYKNPKASGRTGYIIKELEREDRLDKERKLRKDLFHKTPSPLSTLISGNALSGWEVGKTKDGKTLSEIYRAPINFLDKEEEEVKAKISEGWDEEEAIKSVYSKRFERDPKLVIKIKEVGNKSVDSNKCPYSGYGCETKLGKKQNGEFYVEVHHIDPLSQKGEDALPNLIPICANCHRKAHFASEEIKKEMRKNFFKIRRSWKDLKEDL